MEIIKVVIGLLLLNLLLFGGLFIYNNYLSEEIQDIKISNLLGSEVEIINVSSEVTQFYPNMRFNHNKITYFIEDECSEEKKKKIEHALVIIRDNVKVIDFYTSDRENDVDILVGCSPDSFEKEKNIFVIGEGGPTNITNTSMPVISKGKVLLFNETKAKCERPLLEIHEVLHVFGYDHINNSKYIMYPFLECDQVINNDLIKHMNKLYSIDPFAELYLEDIAAYKERYLGRWYLNFNITIVNWGIIEAKDVSVEIFADGKSMSFFELGNVGYGYKDGFIIKNVQIPGKTEKLWIEIETPTKEGNKENNVLILEELV